MYLQFLIENKAGIGGFKVLTEKVALLVEIDCYIHVQILVKE